MSFVTSTAAIAHLVLATGASATAGAVSAAAVPTSDADTNADADTTDSGDTVTVTGERVRRAATSTKLPLTLQETPQSVTIVDRQRIEDFNLTSITEVLAQTPGVTISSTDSNRTNFNIRGFAVRNFQFDGVPTIYQVSGYENSAVADTAAYERIEVIRGAAALVTGVGDPSATINLIRKRAPAVFGGYFNLQAGNYANYRGEFDVGGPVNESGTIRARVVGAYTDRESYIDLQRDRLPLAYGTLEWDVTPTTRLRVGAEYFRSDSRGAGWGSVPLLYNDGTRTDFPRSFTGTTHWAQWLRKTATVFAAAEQDLGENWLLRVSYNGRRADNDSTLFNIPNGLPRRDGTGLGAPFSFYGEVDQNEDAFDAYVSGKFTLLGREHEIVGGANYFWRNFLVPRSRFATPAEGLPPGYPTTSTPDIDPWNPQFAQPRIVRDDRLDFTDELKQFGGYGVVRLNPADWLKVIAGVRYTDYRRDRVNYVLPDSPTNRQNETRWAPYGGVVIDVVPAVSVYASYATVFNPVTARDINNEVLPPTTGANYEAGIKATPFGEGFTIAAAGFHIKQDGLVTTDPNGIPMSLPGNLTPSISVSGVKTWGGEFEVAGEILPGWTINGSYTYAKTKDRFDVRVNPFFPLHIGRVYTTYRLPGNRLTVGGGVTAQSRIYDRGNVPSGRFTAAGAPILLPGTVEQGSYATVDALARFALTDRVTIGINATNLFDRKYYRNVRFQFGGPGGYWADPRRVTGNVRVAF